MTEEQEEEITALKREFPKFIGGKTTTNKGEEGEKEI